MNPQGSPVPVTHNPGQGRFELEVDGHLAFASYTLEGRRATFDHTYVPDALRGRGLAAVVVRAALEEAGRQRWEVVPRCSYVAAFIGRNPEFAGLVAGRPGPD